MVLGELERTRGYAGSNPSEHQLLRTGYVAAESRVERSQLGQVGAPCTESIDAPGNLDRFALGEEHRFMLRVNERSLELVRCPAGMFRIARKGPKVIGENDREVLGESMG